MKSFLYCSVNIQKGMNAFLFAVENQQLNVASFLLDARADLIHSKRHVSSHNLYHPTTYLNARLSVSTMSGKTNISNCFVLF